MESIYLSALQHTQGIETYPVIKGGCSCRFPSIIVNSTELLWPNYHGLYCPGLVSKEEQNRLSHSYVRSSSVLFYYFWINRLFLFTKVISVIFFIPLCCICVILRLSLFLGLVGLQSHLRTFLSCLLYHHLFKNLYALFSVMRLFSFILGISYFWMVNLYVWSIMYNL